MADTEAKLQKASKEFQKIQEEMTATIEARQKLDYQLTESDGVLKELNLLTPNNIVYKLIGPALVAQDQSEAKQTVEKRLEFIKKEIGRIEEGLKTLGDKGEVKKLEIVKLQGEYQKQTQSQSTPVAKA